jgi:formylglycine-generating enzyme required for sulfatase activity
MAPEQACGLQVDARGDLFSLGCVLYLLSTGQAPFQGKDAVSILLAVVSAEPVAPQVVNPALPRALSALIMRLLAKKPADRPLSAQTVVEALSGLERLLATAPTAPKPGRDAPGPKTTQSWHSPSHQESRRNPRGRDWFIAKWGLAGTAAGVVVLGLLMWCWFRPWSSSSPTPSIASTQPTDPVQPLPEVSAAAPEPPPGPAALPMVIENSIDMKMVLIPAGTFDMGSQASDPFAVADEKPPHRVRISQPFYLGIYEVTQEQYRHVVGFTSSYFSATGQGKEVVAGIDTSLFPVENVNWETASAFCEKLTALEAKEQPGWVYRLPTEAEWEYACRAGSTTIYSFGDDRTELDDYAWYGRNSGGGSGHPYPVGTKRPNDFGLYDMHGNVWEWCQDYYGPYEGDAVDPLGPEQGSERVRRGGSFPHDHNACRSATRGKLNPTHVNYNLGFRVARVPSDL